MEAAVKALHYVQGLPLAGKWLVIVVLGAGTVTIAWLILQSPPQKAIANVAAPSPPPASSQTVTAGRDINVESGGVGVNYGTVHAEGGSYAVAEQLRIQNEANARRDAEEAERRELIRRRDLALQLASHWVSEKGDGIPPTDSQIFTQATPSINRELERRGETWRLSAQVRRKLGLP